MADLNSTIVRGNLRVTDDINTSGTINGNGSGLTNLNAGNLGSGTVPSGRLPSGSESQAGILQLGTTATTAAKGNHTHTLVIRNSGDSADVSNLSANTSYILKAGGSSYTFKTPANDGNTNYYATSDFTSSNGTKIATGYSSGTASATYDLYVPTGSTSQAGILQLGTTATTAAKGNHTHTASIASGGSSPTALSANTTYTLTAGGSTVVFTTPADDNTFPVISTPSSTTLTEAQKTAIINGCVTDSGYTAFVNSSGHFTFFPGSYNPQYTGNKHYGVFTCFDSLYGYTINTNTNEIALEGLGVYEPTFYYTNSSNDTVYLRSPAGYSSWPDGLHHYMTTTEILAPSIAKGQAYAVGDVITYNGKFYRCTTAHTQSNGSYVYSSDKWTEISSRDLFVNTYTNQTVGGTKTFSGRSIVISGASGSANTQANIVFDAGSSGYTGTTTIYKGANNGTNVTLTLPTASGTLATTDDLNAGNISMTLNGAVPSGVTPTTLTNIIVDNAAYTVKSALSTSIVSSTGSIKYLTHTWDSSTSTLTVSEAYLSLN